MGGDYLMAFAWAQPAKMQPEGMEEESLVGKLNYSTKLLDISGSHF